MKAFILSLKGKDKTVALRKFFELLNVVQDKEGLKLALTEQQTLIYFYLIKDISSRHRFSAVGKKEVREMAIKDGWDLSAQNINNKLYSLIEKGFLVKDKDEVVAKDWLESAILNLLNAIDNNKEYDIKFRFGNDSQPAS